MFKIFFKSKSDFSKNVLTLMVGTTIAQAIPIAIMPILTRIYTPDEFGLFALYMGIAALLAVMATGRYELAIVLPDNNKEAINIVVLSLMITLLISVVTLVAVILFNAEITSFLNSPGVSGWLYLLPCSVLVTGFYQSMNYWMNRNKRYRDMAFNRVLQASASGGTNLSMGFGGFGGIGLILGSLIGQGISGLNLGVLLLKRDKGLFKEAKFEKIIYLLKKYKKLPIYNLPTTLIEALKLSAINIIIAKLFAISVLGQFSLAWRMLQIPMALLGNSLSQVFFQKIASVEKNDLSVIIKQFVINTSLIISPVFIAIYLFSEDIFVIVFGEQWQVAGEAASILTPWLFLTFLTQPLSAFFVVVNRQEVTLIFSILSLALLFTLIALYRDLEFISLLNIITIIMSITLIIYLLIVVLYSYKIKD